MKKAPLVIFLLTLAQNVYAQGGAPFQPAGGGVSSPIKAKTIAEFADNILGIVIQVGIPVAVIMIVYTGFLFVTAGGNSEKLDTAKKAFLWTVIGAGVLLGAKAISFAIQGTIANL